MMNVTSEDPTTKSVLNDPSVQKAIGFLYHSIGTCAEDDFSNALMLCTNYMCAFILRILINQSYQDACTLSNELQYYGTKFIIDYSLMPDSGGGCDE